MAEHSKKAGFFGNPFMKQVLKFDDESRTDASYLGVLLKCSYFLLFILVGVALSVILRLLPLENVQTAEGQTFLINKVEIIVAIISFVAVFAGSIICAFARKTIPIFGALSCVGIGYIISFIGGFVPDYKPLILLALLLTFALVVAMLIIFSLKIVKSNSKFFSFLYSVLFAISISSLILFVCRFIPVLNAIPAFIFSLPLLYISISVIYIMLGCGFLLHDFESMRHTVQNNAPKSVEWLLSYAIVFDVVWIFFEILDLLTYLKRND